MRRDQIPQAGSVLLPHLVCTTQHQLRHEVTVKAMYADWQAGASCQLADGPEQLMCIEPSSNSRTEQNPIGGTHAAGSLIVPVE